MKDTRERDPTVLYCPESVLHTLCQPYYKIEIVSSDIRQVFFRRYPKLLTALGNLGGTAKTLTLFGAILYYFYSTRYMNINLIDNMFDYQIGDKAEFSKLYQPPADEEQNALIRKPPMRKSSKNSKGSKLSSNEELNNELR